MDTSLTTIPYFSVSDDSYIARQLANGKILMCGTFGSSNGSGPGRLARFNNDGSLDTTFTHTIDWGPSGCYDLDLADDGKALVAGVSTPFPGFISPLKRAGNKNRHSFGTDKPGPTMKVGLSLPRHERRGYAKPKWARFNRFWYLENQFFNTPMNFFHWGAAGDIPVAGDYDGDLRTDYAVFRPAEGNWYIYNSQTGFYAFHWGLAGDIPVPGDYDGDGKTDIAVFRPSEGNWYIMKSQDGFYAYHWGATGDVPIPSQTIYQSGFPRAK